MTGRGLPGARRGPGIPGSAPPRCMKTPSSRLRERGRRGAQRRAGGEGGAASPPLEIRWALFEERAHPLAHVIGGRQEAEEIRLEREAVVEVHLHPAGRTLDRQAEG